MTGWVTPSRLRRGDWLLTYPDVSRTGGRLPRCREYDAPPIPAPGGQVLRTVPFECWLGPVHRVQEGLILLGFDSEQPRRVRPRVGQRGRTPGCWSADGLCSGCAANLGLAGLAQSFRPRRGRGAGRFTPSHPVVVKGDVGWANWTAPVVAPGVGSSLELRWPPQIACVSGQGSGADRSVSGPRDGTEGCRRWTRH